MSLDQELNRAVRTAYVGLNRTVIDRTHALPKMLLKRARKNILVGNTIEFDIWYERLPTGAYGPYQPLPTRVRESTAQGTLRFRNYAATLQIDGPTLRANSGINIGQIMNIDSIRELPSKQTAETLFNILDEQMQRAIKDLTWTLGTHMYGDGSANSNQALTGTVAIVNNSTASYAGLVPTDFENDDVTSNSWWTPQVLANSGTNRAMTLELIRRMSTSVRRGDEQDEDIVCVMNNNLWEELQGILEGSKTYESDTLHSIGVENVKYQYITFIRDPMARNNEMLFLNLNHLYMQVRPSADFLFDGFKQDPSVDGVVAHIIGDCQVVCDDRHRQGLLDDIAGANDTL